VTAFFAYMGVYLVGALICVPLVLLLRGSTDSMAPGLAFLIIIPLYAILFVGAAFFHIGLNRVFLVAARGDSPELRLLFTGGSRILSGLGATLLTTLAFFVGYVLLIVPGIIVGLGLSNTMFYVADSELGAVESMKASWQSLSGEKGKLFLLVLVLSAVNFLGAIPFGLGLVATIPWSLLVLSIVYVRRSGRTGQPLTAAEPMYQGAYGPP
jgi:uncharacterized membrane protein